MTPTDLEDLAERGMLLLSRGVKGREAFRQIAKLAFERGQRMAPVPKAEPAQRGSKNWE